MCGAWEFSLFGQPFRWRVLFISRREKVSDFRVIIVCVIPKKGKDVKAFRGIFTRDKQKEVYPAEEIDSIVCWHPRDTGIPAEIHTGRGYRLVLAVFCYAAYRGYVYSGRGYGIASNGGIQVWQRRGVFSRSRVIYYLRKSGDTLYYSPGKMKPRTGNAFRERLCRYVADDAELCRRIRSLDTWRDKTVLMLQEYHIGH